MAIAVREGYLSPVTMARPVRLPLLLLCVFRIILLEAASINIAML